ncbi:MAG: putative Sulfate-transporting ATPase [Promethearchaeota archaeon]|nr:MAG: putative Sulfate-transporting ATPase [Candidatus Lokiarchaeota archaeon]
MLEVENLSKHFGTLKAVDDISFKVKKGETIGLVGPNGAGKTTTIKMISKILRPTKGKILIKNREGKLQNLRKTSRNLISSGFLIDIPNFYELTPNQLLTYFAKLQNYPNEKIEDRMDELLARFNLFEWKYENLKNFSKGMTQKMGIIQAVIHEPEIIVLDEPQTGLDPKARIDVRDFIRELQGEGKTIFVASHLLHEISEVCDKIALLNRGQIIGFDTIEKLQSKLRTNQLTCEILEPITPETLRPIISKLNEKLDPYLEKSLPKEISKIPIKYQREVGGFIIYYDGKKESRGEMLKILVQEFQSEFTVTSFGEPKTTQLERIYQEMIKEEKRGVKA